MRLPWETTLKEHDFITSEGTVHDDVIKIVLNYLKVSEDGQKLTKVNPFQSKIVSKL
jgi:hypothetical protein